VSGDERTRVAAYALCVDESGRVLLARALHLGELARRSLALAAGAPRGIEAGA
jgi:hypothetical protein